MQQVATISIPSKLGKKFAYKWKHYFLKKKKIKLESIYLFLIKTSERSTHAEPDFSTNTSTTTSN